MVEGSSRRGGWYRGRGCESVRRSGREWERVGGGVGGGV